MLSWLHRLEEIITGLSCFLIVATISLQVFCRYVLNNPLSWPEETAKFAFVWGSFFGATVGLRVKAHIAVEVLVRRLAPRGQRAFEVFVYGCMLVVLAVLLKSGIDMVQLSSTSKLPAINVPLAYLYLPVPVTAALMMLHVGTVLRGSLQRGAAAALPPPDGAWPAKPTAGRPQRESDEASSPRGTVTA